MICCGSLFSSFFASLSLIMATPKKIYDTVSKNIALKFFKYFKDEAMKFSPNHPQRSYVKKTTEATGLPQRTISWICQSPKSSTASSAAAQNSQSVTTPPELPASSTAARITRDHHLRLGKCIQKPLLWINPTSV